MNSLHTIPAYFSKIHLYIILPPSPDVDFSSVFLTKPYIHSPSLPCVLHAPYILPFSNFVKRTSYEAVHRSKQTSNACASSNCKVINVIIHLVLVFDLRKKLIYSHKSLPWISLQGPFSCIRHAISSQG